MQCTFRRQLSKMGGSLLPLYSRTLAIREKALGPEHPSVATTLNNLAELYKNQDRYGEALACFRRASAILAGRMVAAAKNARMERARNQTGTFPGLVQTAYGLATQLPHQKPALADETLVAAQRGSQTSAGHESEKSLVSGVLSAQFSPDGTRIVTASSDDTARLWRIFSTTQALVDYAKKNVPRCLTSVQRKQFHLSATLPAWCIDMGKYPYDTDEWRSWLREKRAGANPDMPN